MSETEAQVAGRLPRREGPGRPPQGGRFRFSAERLREQFRLAQLTPGEVERWLREQDPPTLLNINNYLCGTVPQVESAAALAAALGCDVLDFMEPVPPATRAAQVEAKG